MNLLVFSLTHHTKAPPPPAPAWRRRRWRSQPPPRSVPRRRWRRPRRRPRGAPTSGAPPPRPPCELEHTPHGPGMGAFGWLKLRGDIRGYGMIWIWESIQAGICVFFGFILGVALFWIFLVGDAIDGIGDLFHQMFDDFMGQYLHVPKVDAVSPCLKYFDIFHLLKWTL